MLTSGHLLADRYRLGRRIAVGGMGEVWEAEDARLDRRVAVKVLKAELCGDAEFLHRFRTEARTTASLNHPGVAGVHDYGETAAVADGPKDTAYLVMELVEGEPLAAILARERRLSTERTLDMLEQAGHALQAAHARGLVHRDIKPGNILITPTGVVKLTDFGIAKAADAAPVTRSGMVMGTAHYIAPEQAVGEEAAPASDVYSLAAVGYECLSGHRPFRSENAVTVAMMHIRDVPPPLPPDVPRGARALVEATLVKDPRQRYGTGGEFATAVAAVRAGRPLPAPSGYTPPATMAAHTPPTGTPAIAAPLTGPHTPAGPHTPQGMPSGMLPVQQTLHRRSNAWLWVLLAAMIAIAIGLLIWAVVATNTRSSGVRGTGETNGIGQQAELPAQGERAGVPGADGQVPRESGEDGAEISPAGRAGERPEPGAVGARPQPGQRDVAPRVPGPVNSTPQRRDAARPGSAGPAEQGPGPAGEPVEQGGVVRGASPDVGAAGFAPAPREAPAPETPFPPTSAPAGASGGSGAR